MGATPKTTADYKAELADIRSLAEIEVMQEISLCTI